MKPFTPGVTQDRNVRGVDDSVPCADANGVEAAAPWSSCMTVFDVLNESTARVATT